MLEIIRICIYLIATYSVVSGGLARKLHVEPTMERSLFEDAMLLSTCRTSELNLSDFSFKPRRVNEEDTACLTLQMFREMDFISYFSISENTLLRFILQVKKEYKKVPYHNWIHGFSVLQFTFAVLKNCKLLEKEQITHLEGLALLTSAMSHDIGHPGTNNNFQKETNTTLAQKYMNQSSILERYHINKTLNLFLNSETNFIADMNEKNQIYFKDLIGQIILATDLPMQLKQLSLEQEMAAKGYNKLNEQHRQLLRSVIISCADLSDQTRDWASARLSAKLLLKEFFEQGDKEKELGLIPWKIMDREQANIPETEIEFISQTLLPIFQVLLSLNPEMKVVMDSIQERLVCWRNSIPYFDDQLKQGRNKLEILLDSELENVCTKSK